MPSVRQFDPEVDYYAILKVPVTATKSEITRSYRALMRTSHPDNFTDPGARNRAEEQAKQINVAYTVLSQAGVRREYDQVVRRNVMVDTIRQRYTTVPPTSNGAPLRREHYNRSQRRTTQPQQSDLGNAVRQLAITFGGVALGIIAVIILLTLAATGIQLLFS